VARAASRKWQERLRGRVRDAYGGACECCGETAPEFLTVDHIAGDGAKHRREVGRGGTTFYRWLELNGFPKGNFRLLCWNCNAALHYSGYCPHAKREKATA
jgi:hypothetical protein